MTPQEIEDLQLHNLYLEEELKKAKDEIAKLKGHLVDLARLAASALNLVDEEEYDKNPILGKMITQNSMIYLNGRDKPSFRCACGGNVFAHYEDEIYICNSCSAQYKGTSI